MVYLRLVGAFVVSGSLIPIAFLTRILAWVGLHDASLRRGAWIQRWWARGVRRALGVELRVEGRPPEQATLVVANHLSYLDILVLGSITPGRFVAKSEIAGWPVFGELSRSVGTLFISQKKRRDVLRVAEEMERTLTAGVPVILFPEAAASRGATIAPFKSSLLEPLVRLGLPARVAAIRYESPGSTVAPAWTMCWWGGMQLWKHVRLLLTQPRRIAVLTFDDESVVRSDRKELSNELAERMERRFVPVRQEPLPGSDYPWPHLVDAVRAEAESVS